MNTETYILCFLFILYSFENEIKKQNKIKSQPNDPIIFKHVAPLQETNVSFILA